MCAMRKRPVAGCIDRGGPTHVAHQYAAVRAVERPRQWPKAKHTTELRPLILSEYCHAMGNSSGNLQEWWDIMLKVPSLERQSSPN